MIFNEEGDLLFVLRKMRSVWKVFFLVLNRCSCRAYVYYDSRVLILTL